MVKKRPSATKKTLKRRKKMVPPSKMITILFYHPDHRINFFMADFLLKPLVKQKKLRQYIYKSSGVEDTGSFPQYFKREHTLSVFEDEVWVAVEALKEDGWIFINPEYNDYGKERTNSRTPETKGGNRKTNH